jgi:transposase
MGLDANGFHVLPHRWVVEGTFAWLMFQRRLARDDELLEATTQNLVYIALDSLVAEEIGVLDKIHTVSRASRMLARGHNPNRLRRCGSTRSVYSR